MIGTSTFQTLRRLRLVFFVSSQSYEYLNFYNYWFYLHRTWLVRSFLFLDTLEIRDEKKYFHFGNWI